MGNVDLSSRGKIFDMRISGILLLILLFFSDNHIDENPIEHLNKVPKRDRIDLAIQQEYEMTRDPNTGLVPREKLFEVKSYLNNLQNNRAGIPGIEWEERGPSNVGGRTRAILIDANDPSGNTIFAGSVAGGLWKCTGGLSSNPNWSKVDDFFDNLAVSAIAQDPGNSNIIYFGTGEGFYNADAVRGMGIWKSTDGGNSFTHLSSTDNNTFHYTQKIIVDDNGHIYAATRNGGVQKSTDGGISWMDILSSNNFSLKDRIADLEMASNGDLFAAVGIFQEDGIYKSSDSGSTWSKLTSGLPSSSFQRIELATAPSNSNVVYALFHDTVEDSCKGIYRTSDGGLNWVLKENPSAIGMSNFARNQAWYDLAIGVDPSDENRVIIGGIDLLSSTDGGNTWNQISQWYGGGGLQYVHADQHSIVFLNSNIIYFGNDGGVFATSNGTATNPTITSINDGYNVTQFYSCAIYPTEGEDFYLAGSQDNGTHKFENTGINSTVEVTGGDGGFCHIDQNTPLIQITTYVYNNYRVSTNGGTSFVNRNFSNTGRFINPFAYDDNEKKIYGAHDSNKYFRWNNPANAGSSFDVVNVPELGGKVSHVLISPNVADRVYFGTGSGEIVYVDNASTGTSKSGTVIRNGSGYVSCIAIEVGNEDHILFTLSNYGVTSIYESIDGGINWQQVEGNLPDMPIRWVIFNPNDADQALVATELGVWSTDDLDGANTIWDPSNNGLANVRVDMLKSRSSDGEVVAATHGRGLFTTNHFTSVTASFDLAAGSSSEYSSSGAEGVCGENFSQLSIPVSLNRNPSSPVTVNVTVDNSSTGNSSDDFILETPSLIFQPNGSLTQNVTLKLMDDAIQEINETIVLDLIVTGAEPGSQARYVHTILDNDIDPVTASAESDFDIGSDTDLLAHVPFRGYYEDEKSQLLFRADELTANGLTQGPISKIALEVQELGSNQAYQNFTVKIKHTTTNEFTSQNQSFESGLTSVYNATFDPQLGWNIFNFSNPFEWNGQDNIILEFCFDNGSWTADDVVYATESGFNSVLYRYEDNDSGCSMTSAEHLISKRPNVRFTQPFNVNPGSSLSSKSSSINSGQSAHFYDDNGNIMLSVESNGSLDIGCLDVSIDQVGTGQVFPNWLEGFGHTQKTFYIDAAQDDVYQITLYFTQDELAAWSDINNLGMLKTPFPLDNNTGGLFEFVENQDLTISNFGNDNHYAVSATFNGFSGFALSDFSGAVVPLDLLSFSGENYGEFNIINWKTENEINVDGFIIERSEDGITYEAIDKVNAVGDGIYEYIDRQLSSNSNIHYYRLRIDDLDGFYEYSDQLTLQHVNLTDQSIKLFPNPFTDNITIKGGKQSNKTINIYSLRGQKLLSTYLGQDSQINLNTLDSGLYLIEVEERNDHSVRRTYHKMIKQEK